MICEWPNCTMVAQYATYATRPWGSKKAWRHLCDKHEKQAVRLRRNDERAARGLNVFMGVSP